MVKKSKLFKLLEPGLIKWKIDQINNWMEYMKWIEHGEKKQKKTTKSSHRLR